LECDEIEPAAPQLLLEKTACSPSVEEDLRVVVTQREHVRHRLASDALVDHGERGPLDVEQVQSAPKARLEEAELRLRAGTDGQRAEWTVERQGLAERPQDPREGLADVDLVAAVARPDLVLLGHQRAGRAHTRPHQPALRGAG